MALDFSRIWATNGGTDAPTDEQYLLGFDWMGFAPPTVEQFNWMFQNVDKKFQEVRVNVAPTYHPSSEGTYGIASAYLYGHAMASSELPQAAGVANAGIDNGKFARERHIHPAQTSVTGNAGTATTWQTSRTITLTGAVTGAVSISGGSNVTLATTATAASLGFTQSLAANGWTKLPNGLIFQWGMASLNSGSLSTVNLPVSFSANFFQVIATPRRNYLIGGGENSAYAYPASLSQVTLVSDGVGGVSDIAYFAVGR